MTQTTLLADLQSIVGAPYARVPKDEEFAVDGMRPEVIVEPGSYEEVAAILRYANERGLAVIPQGGRWYIFIGNVPRAYDIALSTTRLDKIIEYEPADMTVTCQAGMSGGRLNTHLEGHGQMVPFAGANPDDNMTIGGLLAIAPSFMPHGTPRDFTIGLKVATVDGRIIRAGGKVVKNVAGYDLCKLFIGSLGTLGVIVECTFKLVPAPKSRERIELEFTSFDEACRFASELHRRGLSLWSADVRRPMEWIDGVRTQLGPLVLSFMLWGTAISVDRSRAEIGRLAKQYGVSKFDPDRLPITSSQAPAWSEQTALLGAEIRVPPSVLPRLVEALDATAPGSEIAIEPLIGTAHVDWFDAGEDEQLVHRVLLAVSSLGGTTMIIDCSTELKRRIDVFGDPPPAFDLMRRVKQEFDPNGILSPGRFVGRL